MDWGYIISVTIIGMLVVFAALILLVMFVASMGLLSSKPTQKVKKDKGIPAEKEPTKTTVAKGIAPTENDDIDGEIVAVITAAISQMRLNEGKTAGFRVKNIARASNSRPIWGLAGMQENTRAF